jgi:hypothetical protein
MILIRQVGPEWLDELPGDDPRAIRSRLDLKRINLLTAQASIMRRLLLDHWRREPPRTIIELGAGDGTFMLGLARTMKFRWPGVSLILIDRQNIVSAKTREDFARLGWRATIVRADVFDFLGSERPRADVITSNLFLHHFSREQLERLFAYVATSTTLFAACEPRRGLSALTASRLLVAIGCNDVTRHDAVASVRAGFCGQELSKLWSRERKWELNEGMALPFTHRFVAHLRDYQPHGL